MNTSTLRQRLLRLTCSQVAELAQRAGVSRRALLYVRSGRTVTCSEPVLAKVREAKIPRGRKE